MKKFLSLAALAMTVTACGSLPGRPSNQTVDLKFAAQINGQHFACGQRYEGVGTTRSTITPSDFRMYVSDVKLFRKDGITVPVQLTQDGIWQEQSVAMLDF